MEINYHFQKRTSKKIKWTADVMANICGLRSQLTLDSGGNTQLVWYNAQVKHFVGEGCKVTLALLLIKLHRQVMQRERE